MFCNCRKFAETREPLYQQYLAAQTRLNNVSAPLLCVLHLTLVDRKRLASADSQLWTLNSLM